MNFIHIPKLSHMGVSYLRWHLQFFPSYLIPVWKKKKKVQILLSLLEEAGRLIHFAYFALI